MAGWKALEKTEPRRDHVVTDAGLKCAPAGLKDLTDLDLIGTQVTDEGLKDLAGFKRCGKLKLFGTKVTWTPASPHFKEDAARTARSPTDSRDAFVRVAVTAGIGSRLLCLPARIVMIRSRALFATFLLLSWLPELLSGSDRSSPADVGAGGEPAAKSDRSSSVSAPPVPKDLADLLKAWGYVEFPLTLTKDLFFDVELKINGQPLLCILDTKRQSHQHRQGSCRAPQACQP